MTEITFRSDMQVEEWGPVVGFEGRYEVSSLGRVKSLLRDKELKPDLISGKRPQVTLYSSEGVRVRFRVGTLVLRAFKGGPPEGKPWVLHWDDNPANNALVNLRWGSPSENTRDSVRNGTHFGAARVQCKWGHPFDLKNTAYYRGKRNCRECDKEGQQEIRDRKKAERDNI